jgi:N-acetylmuramic acid 6-phosphate etherase
MQTEARNPRTMQIDRLSTLAMLTVINEQDAGVPHAVREALSDIARAVDAIAERMHGGGRLIYTGAGTSGRLGVLDAVECVPTFSVPPGLVIGVVAGGSRALTESIEGAEDSPEVGRADLRALSLTALDSVVGIAASGRTPYVIGALDYAKAVGALTVAVSCNSPAPILDIAGIGIAAVVGPEVITGSTRLKAGTAQKLILNMISTATMIRLGKVYGNLMVDVQVTNNKLADRACRIIMEVTGVDYDRAAELLSACDNQVKTAIVVALLKVTPDEARQRLDANVGVLGRVI